MQMKPRNIPVDLRFASADDGGCVTPMTFSNVWLYDNEGSVCGFTR